MLYLENFKKSMGKKVKESGPGNKVTATGGLNIINNLVFTNQVIQDRDDSIILQNRQR